MCCSQCRAKGLWAVVTAPTAQRLDRNVLLIQTVQMGLLWPFLAVLHYCISQDIVQRALLSLSGAPFSGHLAFRPPEWSGQSSSPSSCLGSVPGQDITDVCSCHLDGCLDGRTIFLLLLPDSFSAISHSKLRWWMGGKSQQFPTWTSLWFKR